MVLGRSSIVGKEMRAKEVGDWIDRWIEILRTERARTGLSVDGRDDRHRAYYWRIDATEVHFIGTSIGSFIHFSVHSTQSAGIVG